LNESSPKVGKWHLQERHKQHQCECWINATLKISCSGDELGDGRCQDYRAKVNADLPALQEFSDFMHAIYLP
jgi:hypothetical protein